MKTKSKIVIIYLISTLLIIASCSEDGEIQKEKKITPVKIAKVTKEEFSIPVHTSGLLAPTKEIKLSFKTPGVIEKIYARDGQYVNKGDLIAKLDLSEIKAQVLQAREGYDKAKRDYERVQNLFADSVVTLEQLQNVETALTVAKSTLQVAEYNENLSVITAPGSGKVLHHFAETSELVNAGTPIVLFGTSGAGWLVRVGVTDKDIVKLNLGDRAEVFIDAYPGKKFTAVVSEIGGAANPVNGTFKVELSLDTVTEKLAAGFVVKVDIYPSTTKSFFTIPVEAVYEADGAGAVVFIIDKKRETALKRSVEIAKIFPDKVAVSGGLDDSDYVITSGVEYLISGSAVEVMK
jgi:RND family efflux transporter MFP subunit